MTLPVNETVSSSYTLQHNPPYGSPVSIAGQPFTSPPIIQYTTPPQSRHFEKVSDLSIQSVLKLQEIQAQVRTQHPNSDTRVTIHFELDLRERFVNGIITQMHSLHRIIGFPPNFVPTVHNLEQLPDPVLWTLIYIYACPNNAYPINTILETQVGPFHEPPFSLHSGAQEWFNEYVRYTTRLNNICDTLAQAINLKQFRSLNPHDIEDIVMPPFSKDSVYMTLFNKIKPDKVRKFILGDVREINKIPNIKSLINATLRRANLFLNEHTKLQDFHSSLQDTPNTTSKRSLHHIPAPPTMENLPDSCHIESDEDDTTCPTQHNIPDADCISLNACQSAWTSDGPNAIDSFNIISLAHTVSKDTQDDLLLNTLQNSPSSPGGCFHQLLSPTGTCNIPNCKRIHNRQVQLATWTWLRDQLQRSLYNQDRKPEPPSRYPANKEFPTQPQGPFLLGHKPSTAQNTYTTRANNNTPQETNRSRENRAHSNNNKNATDTSSTPFARHYERGRQPNRNSDNSPRQLKRSPTPWSRGNSIVNLRHTQEQSSDIFPDTRGPRLLRRTDQGHDQPRVHQIDEEAGALMQQDEDYSDFEEDDPRLRAILPPVIIPTPVPISIADPTPKKFKGPSGLRFQKQIRRDWFPEPTTKVALVKDTIEKEEAIPIIEFPSPSPFISDQLPPPSSLLESDNAYKILHISPTATLDTITTAYNYLHATNPTPPHSDMFQRAFHRLNSLDSRSAHDKEFCYDVSGPLVTNNRPSTRHLALARANDFYQLMSICSRLLQLDSAKNKSTRNNLRQARPPPTSSLLPATPAYASLRKHECLPDIATLSNQDPSQRIGLYALRSIHPALWSEYPAFHTLPYYWPLPDGTFAYAFPSMPNCRHPLVRPRHFLPDEELPKALAEQDFQRTKYRQLCQQQEALRIISNHKKATRKAQSDIEKAKQAVTLSEYYCKRARLAHAKAILNELRNSALRYVTRLSPKPCKSHKFRSTSSPQSHDYDDDDASITSEITTCSTMHITPQSSPSKDVATLTSFFIIPTLTLLPAPLLATFYSDSDDASTDTRLIPRPSTLRRSQVTFGSNTSHQSTRLFFQDFDLSGSYQVIEPISVQAYIINNVAQLRTVPSTASVHTSPIPSSPPNDNDCYSEVSTITERTPSNIRRALYLLSKPRCKTILNSARLPATVVIGKSRIHMQNVLPDSGASHQSYISKQMYDTLRSHMSDEEVQNWFTPVSSSVTLADGQSQMRIHGQVPITLDILDSNEQSHIGTITCHIIDSPRTQCIIGWPDLTNVFADVFIDLIKTTAALHKSNSQLITRPETPTTFDNLPKLAQMHISDFNDYQNTPWELFEDPTFLDLTHPVAMIDDPETIHALLDSFLHHVSPTDTSSIPSLVSDSDLVSTTIPSLCTASTSSFPSLSTAPLPNLREFIAAQNNPDLLVNQPYRENEDPNILRMLCPIHRSRSLLLPSAPAPDFSHVFDDDATIHRFLTERQELAAASLSVTEGDIRDLFLDKPIMDAPEENEIPEPSLFLFEKPTAEMHTEYLELLQTQISPDFLTAVPDVLDFFKSEWVEKLFHPTEWGGITGIDPIELEPDENCPQVRKPDNRQVPPKLREAYEKELKRLCEYYFIPSTSSTATNMVVAAKKTPPFIRLCLDLRWLNKVLKVPQYPIPRPLFSLRLAQTWTLFADIDLTNSYHQLLLAAKTRRLMAVQTPLGLLEPVFLPEGVSPASQILQRVVRELFCDFIDEGWLIVIFDNILLGANDYPTLFTRIQRVFNRCRERNVILKLPKSFFGFKEVNFFGYQVRDGTVSIDDRRKTEAQKIPMPFFISPFIPGYADIMAPLYDMTKDGFSGQPKDITDDHRAAFERSKTALAHTIELHTPDYSLP